MSTFERMLRVLSGRDGDEASCVAASLRPTETRRQRIAGKKGRASKRSAAVVQSERLEQRLALTIGIYTGGTTGGGPTPWAVITSDNADNVYVQQVATVAQNLIVADNPSFNSYQTIPAIDALTTVYATNGTNVSVAGVQSTERDPLRTSFLLSRAPVVTAKSFITGSVGYGGNTWSFTNGGDGVSLNFLLTGNGVTSDPSLIFPISGQLLPAGGTGGADSIGILWSSPPTQAVGIGPPVIGSVNYISGTTPFIDFGLRPSAGFFTTVNLPITSHNPGGMIPGTLSGLLTVSGYTVDFRNNNLFTTAATGIAGNQLLFGNNGTPSTTGVVIINQGTPAQRTQQVTGYVDLDAGVVYLEFRNGVTLQDPGPVSISANYAVYNQDARSSELTFSPGQDFSRELYVDLLTPDATLNIQSPILQTAGTNGLSLSATNVNIDAQVKSINRFDVIGSTVDRNAQSTTATARAVVSTAGTISGVGVPAGRGGQGYDPTSLPLVSISGGGGTGATATATILNGVVFGITVTNPGSGYTSIPTVTIDPPPVLASLVPLTPQVEQLNFNAAVAATSYDLRIGDDPNTFGIDHGRLFVSPTGSLSGALSGSAAGATTPASSLFVQADTSDLLIEGTVYATSQSYLMRSPAAAQALAPFLFSTTSVQSSAETGLIRGGRVAITLANDADTPEQGSALASTVNLRTQVDSLRIKAATRTGSQLSGPFPYELSISDVDDISFDAVAASSNAIALIAAGNISFSSTLATAGDLSIAAGGDFTVSAPLSTSRGKIAISAANVTVNNSIRVLDPPDDSTVDDITLTATGGNLSLNGAVSAVNNVRLIQRNKADSSGKIFGPSRVVAQGISVEAEGSADVRTDVVTLAGRALGDFSVDELNDITITSLRSLGFVTLRAGGTDPGVGSPMSPNPIALTATLQDVVALQTSAPKGSVNIVSNTARAVTLGNPTTLAAGTATSMQAAGSVLIRSTAGSLTVADAPLGGGSAMAVRVATTANLPGTYLQNTPGQFASTLTGSKAPLSIDGVVLRVGDRVLLKNQTNGPQNGVYTVTVAGSVGRAWKLTRSVDADTSAELPFNTFVQVGEGLNAAGKVFSLAYSPTFGTSPIVAILSPNQPGAARVRVATTAVLPAIYNSGAGTITASAPGAIPAIDGVSLVMGDRVLVRLGTTGSAAANGVYEVTSMGGGGSSWVLTRALDPDTLVTIQMGYFATTEGSFRASATGQAFLLAYNPLGNDPMSVNPMAGSGRPVTNIGTEDINSLTTFVVSSTAGTNAAAGSLGKILQLRQANDTSSSTLNPAQTMSFKFATFLPGLGGAPAGAIRLLQELPAISKAFAIDGSQRIALPGVSGPASPVVVDGSRITTTRAGTSASLATEVNGFEFVPGSQATGGAAGGSVAAMTVAGFVNGAGVKMKGVGGILVSGLTLGRNETGDRLSNKYGVLATGVGAGGTIIGSTIVGSLESGVRTDGSAAGVTVVGSTIGAVNQNNKIGFDIAGGGSRLGVNADGKPAASVTTTFAKTDIILPASVPTAGVFLGQSVSGAGIAFGSVITAINGEVIRLSKAMTASGQVVLTLGAAARNTVSANLDGMVLAAGSNTVTNTDISGNTYDGIRISGGTQTIGRTALSLLSNAVFANGRWGVNIVTPAVAGQQTITGNFFGSKVQATLPSPNGAGNVGVNGVASVAYRPLAGNTQLDAFGNSYSTASTTGPTPVKSVVRSKFPWRSR